MHPIKKEHTNGNDKLQKIGVKIWDLVISNLVKGWRVKVIGCTHSTRHKTFVKLKWMLHYLPIIIFVMIAAHHFYWVRHGHLSPWLGGGYGMFSTTDYGPSRYIRVYALRNEIIQEEIEIPPNLTMLARKVRGLPDDKNILALALSIENYLDANQHGYPVIRVEVWTSRYDTETLRPTYRKLNEIDYKTNRAKKPE